MPVRDLGTVRPTAPKGTPAPPIDDSFTAHVKGWLALLPADRSSAEWQRDLLTGQLVTVVMSVMLATASVAQAGDTLEALDGKGGTVALHIPGHTRASPCVSNPYFTVLSDHAPLRFGASAPGAGYVACGWHSPAAVLRLLTALLAVPLVLRLVLKFQIVASVNTGDLSRAVTLAHPAERHDHSNSTMGAMVACSLALCCVLVTASDWSRLMRSHAWCKPPNSLLGAMPAVKGLKFTRDKGAEGVVCADGIFFAMILFDILAAAAWLISARAHILYLRRGVFEDAPTASKSPKRVAQTVASESGAGSASYPAVSGGGGRAPAAASGGQGSAGGAEVKSKEADPRSWKKMPI